jgi:hypothetical protein
MACGVLFALFPPVCSLPGDGRAHVAGGIHGGGVRLHLLTASAAAMARPILCRAFPFPETAVCCFLWGFISGSIGGTSWPGVPGLCDLVVMLLVPYRSDFPQAAII